MRRRAHPARTAEWLSRLSVVLLCVLGAACTGGGVATTDAAAAAPEATGRPAADAAPQSRPSIADALPPVARGAAPAPVDDDRIATGRRLFQQKRYREALLPLTQAAGSHPDDAVVWRMLGNTQAHLEDLPAALASLQHAVRLAPQTVGAQYELALVAVNMNRLDEAEKVARSALAVEPDNPRLQELLATVLNHKGDHAAMLELLEPIVRNDPGRNQARYMMGVALFGLQRLPEARDALAEVVRRQPDHAAAQLNLAEVLARLGDVAGAARARAAYQRLRGGGS